jgi:hypothetical protein
MVNAKVTVAQVTAGAAGFIGNSWFRVPMAVHALPIQHVLMSAVDAIQAGNSQVSARRAFLTEQGALLAQHVATAAVH